MRKLGTSSSEGVMFVPLGEYCMLSRDIITIAPIEMNNYTYRIVCKNE